MFGRERVAVEQDMELCSDRTIVWQSKRGGREEGEIKGGGEEVGGAE